MPIARQYIRASIAGLLAGAFVLSSRPGGAQQPPSSDSDAIVVGAGIAGLSAALEMAGGGTRVVVIDMASIFGGHAVMATGDLSIVGTPYQESQGFHDTPDIAFEDFVTWGEDPSRDWVRYYVDHSREQIYDWVTGMGIAFESLIAPPGNTILRTHRTKGRGLGLVTPIYRACLEKPNITFVWNTRLDRLIREGNHIAGVAATDVRNGRSREFRAGAVVLATGGFQSNLDMVRESWPTGAAFPATFLVGSGINSVGSGLTIAKAAGAEVSRLDHQWNYITGLPDPRFPGSKRGLNASNADSIWVNTDGRRFIAEGTSTKFGFPILLKQKDATYWSIFDESAKRRFWVAGSDWGSWDTIERLIFGNADLVKSGQTLAEVAAKSGLPVSALEETVRRYNEMADRGVDEDFGRFGPGNAAPKKISQPPYYAVQFFPLTRKSMGGVVIDSSCRVLDKDSRPIAGLYAAGELTGLAGINGKAGLEGTFLGPSIVTGRVAGRSVLAAVGRTPGPAPVATASFEPPRPAPNSDSRICLSCHDLPKLSVASRPGYWHFERAHAMVLADKRDCGGCHAEMSPIFNPQNHRINRQAQTFTCAICHKGEDR